jgi:hypothetical protein
MRKWKRRMMGGERETRMNGGIIARRKKKAKNVSAINGMRGVKSQ